MREFYLKQGSVRRQGQWLLMIVMLCLAVPALAEGPRMDFKARPSGLRLDRSRLMPRVANELESLAAFDLLSQPGTGMQDHAMFEELRETILRRGNRVTRRALRDQLLELTGLDQSFSTGGAPAAAPRPMRFTFGIHSLRPEIGLKYNLGAAAFRFHVDTAGELGVRFSRRGANRAGVAVTFDGSNQYTLRARLGF